MTIIQKTLASPYLTGRKSASINNVLSLLGVDLIGLIKWCSWQSHQTYAMSVDVRIDTIVHIPVRADSRIPNGAINFMKLSILLGLADSSTMQLFVLMSRTFPPNW